ncbi:hypothetical protein [Thermobaculum terrenum]|uniref:hypothetical protein n=1 Tax=Thermobaculum terrenum TaxID=166501 RepID=UPI00019BEBD8|nr:hypothetical protein [Thermobaculum terrenum]
MTSGTCGLVVLFQSPLGAHVGALGVQVSRNWGEQGGVGTALLTCSGSKGASGEMDALGLVWVFLCALASQASTGRCQGRTVPCRRPVLWACLERCGVGGMPYGGYQGPCLPPVAEGLQASAPV